MLKETKMTPAPEARAVMAAFEAFKEANDARLAEIEKKASADVLLTEKVARIDKAVADAQAALTRLAAPALGGPPAAPSEAKSAWGAYVRRGDERGVLALEEKALSVGTDADGGYVAPPEIDAMIERRLANQSIMRGLATVRQTQTAVFKKPLSITAAAVGWAAETAARTQTNSPTLDLLAFPAGELYAMPAATQTLLDDAVADIDAWLAGEIADAFAAKENDAFLNGDGTAKPKGVLQHVIVAEASHAWGKLGYKATGVAGAFPASNPADVLVDLTYLPKAQYRPGASFIMNRRTLSAIRRFKDTTGAYIWQPTLTAGQPSTLLGYPVAEMEEAPDIATDAYAVMFGDFARGYLIVDRVGVRVLRDPYSAKPYVLFYVTKRVGGGIQNFDAVKLLKFGVS